MKEGKVPEGGCTGKREAALEAEEGGQCPFSRSPVLVTPEDSATIGVGWLVLREAHFFSTLNAMHVHFRKCTKNIKR